MISRNISIAMMVVLLAGIVYAPYTVPDVNVDVNTDDATAAANVQAANTQVTAQAAATTGTPEPALYGGNAEENAALIATQNAGEDRQVTVRAGDNEVVTGPAGTTVHSGDTMVNTQGNKMLIKTADSMVMVNGNSVSVKNMFADASDISVEEATALQRIDISPGLIQVGEAVLQNAQNKIRVKAGGADVEVSAGPTSVTIKDGVLSVSTLGVLIENGVIKVGDIEVKAPSEVIVGDVKVNAKNISLETEMGKPVYKVHGEERQKLFWLFPVTVSTDVTIDAADGKELKVSGPWWDFLAA